MPKSPKEIREELMSAFLALEDLYTNSSDSSKVDYIEIELAEHLMGAIHNLMFHYQEDIPEMRVKRKWGEEMIRAEKLLKKYTEDLNSETLSLKSDFDSSGYLEHREFFGETASKRPKLKRKII